MKKLTPLSIAILALPFSTLADPGGCEGCKDCKKSSCLVAPEIPEGTKPAGKITKAQRKKLIILQEEERLAFDIYNTLGEKYPLNPFKNIPRSEANHMEATARLLEYHGIPKPEKTTPGKYNAPELQKLYDKLVKKGMISEVEALCVGALVEETDIRDLRSMAQDPPSEIAGKLSRKLEIASYNHLRAFVRNLSARGVEYEPELLAKDDFDKIIAGEELDKPTKASQDERGKQGRRKGKGKRNRKRAGQGSDRTEEWQKKQPRNDPKITVSTARLSRR